MLLIAIILGDSAWQKISSERRGLFACRDCPRTCECQDRARLRGDQAIIVRMVMSRRRLPVPVGLANLAEKRSMVVVHGEVCCVFVIQHTITTTSGSQGGRGGGGS
jgi:hypothetical protein